MIGTNRYRSKGASYLYHTYATCTGNCGSFVTDPGTPLKGGPDEQMWDVDDPSFRDKLYNWVRYKKPLPVRPMRKITLNGMDAMVDYIVHRPNGRNANVSSYRGVPLTFSPLRVLGSFPDRYIDAVKTGEYRIGGSTVFPSEVDSDILLQKALAKARTSSWDVGTFAAELGKTTKMIQRVGETTVRRAERIKSQKIIKSYDDFLSAWMEYRYGWRILYYDIMEMNESILRLRGINPLSNRYTAYGKAEDVSNYTTSTVNYFNVATGQRGYTYALGNAQFSASRQDFSRIETRAGVMVQLAAEKLAFVDPFNTLLEITPYALLVNWFFNIKDAVAAFSPTAAGRLTHGFVTKEVSRGTNYQMNVFPTTTNPTNANYRFFNLNKTSVSVTDREVTRVREDPTFNVKFRLQMTPANVLDLIAIMAGQYASLKALRLR